MFICKFRSLIIHKLFQFVQFGNKSITSCCGPPNSPILLTTIDKDATWAFLISQHIYLPTTSNAETIVILSECYRPWIHQINSDDYNDNNLKLWCSKNVKVYVCSIVINCTSFNISRGIWDILASFLYDWRKYIWVVQLKSCQWLRCVI